MSKIGIKWITICFFPLVKHCWPEEKMTSYGTCLPLPHRVLLWRSYERKEMCCIRLQKLLADAIIFPHNSFTLVTGSPMWWEKILLANNSCNVFATSVLPAQHSSLLVSALAQQQAQLLLLPVWKQPNRPQKRCQVVWLWYQTTACILPPWSSSEFVPLME